MGLHLRNAGDSRRRRRWREAGNVIIMAALFMAVLMGFGAMAVDVGVMMWQRRELQNVADAAALAGVQELPNDPSAAVAVATDYARRNGVDRGGWRLESVDLLPAGCTAQARNCTSLAVRVSHRDAPFLLARVLGFTTTNVKASATASIQSPNTAGNAMPWAMKESVRRNARYGDVVTIKYSAQGGDHGNFGALAVPNDRCGSSRHGANLYRCNIQNGATVEVGHTYDTESGNMRGPTQQGMQARLNATDPLCDSFNEVFEQTGSGQWRFRSERCNPWSPAGQGSKRVVLIPVVSDSDLRGRSQVTVLGFALAFLEDFQCRSGNDCDVDVRFVQAVLSPGEDMEFVPGTPLSDIRVPRLTN
ncbi:MAG: pilus assembly protein TadG-related protein [Chloroflexota bacterium]|nr:pilus assembly protein TadG-related protein [Chloroflexota bacterium]